MRIIGGARWLDEPLGQNIGGARAPRAPWSRRLCNRRLRGLPLVTRATTMSIVQNRCPCLPMSKWPGTVVPGRWLSARLRCPAASTPFVWLWILRRPTYPYHLRRSVFCCRWPTSVTVELLANQIKTIWQSWPVQTVIKDSFVWVMGPQRFVTFTLVN